SPRIAEAVRAGAARAHVEVKAVFDRELRQLTPARRARLTSLLIAACSWSLWDLLRTDLNLSQRGAREAMTAMVAAVIEGELKGSGRYPSARRAAIGGTDHLAAAKAAKPTKTS